MDRYGYLENPGEAYQEALNPKRKIPSWVWVVGALVLGVGVWWLVRRQQQSTVGKLGAGATRNVPFYPVTGPATAMQYEGTGLPFGVKTCEPAIDTYLNVDNNGIARVYSADGRAGGLVQLTTGQVVFIPEDVWDQALQETRQMNVDILQSVMPYCVLGPGYIGYVTDGPHLAESVYVTMQGQIGRALTKAEGGDLTFVPLEVIDRTPNIWEIYVKPGIGG